MVSKALLQKTENTTIKTHQKSQVKPKKPDRAKNKKSKLTSPKNEISPQREDNAFRDEKRNQYEQLENTETIFDSQTLNMENQTSIKNRISTKSFEKKKSKETHFEVQANFENQVDNLPDTHFNMLANFEYNEANQAMENKKCGKFHENLFDQVGNQSEISHENLPKAHLDEQVDFNEILVKNDHEIEENQNQTLFWENQTSTKNKRSTKSSEKKELKEIHFEIQKDLENTKCEKLHEKVPEIQIGNLSEIPHGNLPEIPHGNFSETQYDMQANLEYNETNQECEKFHENLPQNQSPHENLSEKLQANLIQESFSIKDQIPSIIMSQDLKSNNQIFNENQSFEDELLDDQSLSSGSEVSVKTAMNLDVDGAKCIKVIEFNAMIDNIYKEAEEDCSLDLKNNENEFEFHTVAKTVLEKEKETEPKLSSVINSPISKGCNKSEQQKSRI